MNVNSWAPDSKTIAFVSNSGGGPSRTITKAALEDRIRGGWAGKMIGVSYGAPTEFRSNGPINDGALTVVARARVERPRPGRPLRRHDDGRDDGPAGLRRHCRTVRRGLQGQRVRLVARERRSAPPAQPRHQGADVRPPADNIHANDIDFQIEADFIGLMSPGLPRESNKFCLRVGPVMNYGDGLYGGMFISGMYTAAFFETDVRARRTRAGLPAARERLRAHHSRRARVVGAGPRRLEAHLAAHRREWDRDESCPDGALRPFNIDARINGAYVALGLLYGPRRLCPHTRDRNARRTRTRTATRRRPAASWA